MRAYLMFYCKAYKCREIGRKKIDVSGLRLERSASISGTDENLVYERRLGELPSQGVLASSTADDEDCERGHVARASGEARAGQTKSANFLRRLKWDPRNPAIDA